MTFLWTTGIKGLTLLISFDLRWSGIYQKSDVRYDMLCCNTSAETFCRKFDLGWKIKFTSISSFYSWVSEEFTVANPQSFLLRVKWETKWMISICTGVNLLFDIKITANFRSLCFEFVHVQGLILYCLPRVITFITVDHQLREEGIRRSSFTKNLIFFVIFPCWFLDPLKALEMWEIYKV